MPELSVFNFDYTSVRVVTSNTTGEPLFVAKDVCLALEYKDPTTAIRSHCKGVQVLHPLQTPGGVQEVRVLTEADVLRLIVSSTLPAAQAFERWVFEEVLPTIRRTGTYSAQSKPQGPQTPQSVEAVMFAEAVNRALNLQGSAALGMVRSAVALRSPEYLPLLPVYAIDAPQSKATAPTSSVPTASITELLKEHDIGVSAVTANKMLAKAGLIEEMTRPSTSGKVKRFWSVTEKGDGWGKNVTSPNNPRETQPHWYRQCFKTLADTYLVA